MGKKRIEDVAISKPYF